MYFETFDAFLAMGKHGLYVWTAYGIGTLVLALNVAVPILSKRKVLAKQQARLRRELAKAKSQ